MSVIEYDTFTSGQLDSTKWQPLQLPMGDGQMWNYGDSQAKVRAQGGTVEITVNPFRLKHDQIHMFDDPKHLVVSPQPIEVAEQGTTRISCEMACESYNGNSDDLLDGMTGLVVADFSQGMVFDWILSGTRAGIIYERLPIPGVTPEGGSFTHVVQSPFVALNRPREFHRYEVTLNRSQHSCEWLVDDRRFFITYDVPVDVKNITLGLLICTLKAPEPGAGSISNHGQGATGFWRQLTISTEPTTKG